MVSFVANPYGADLQSFRAAQCGLGYLGVGIAASKLQAPNGSPCGKLKAAIARSAEHEELTFLRLDLARVSLDAGCEISEPMRFRGIYIPSIELYDGLKDCSNLSFSDCFFSRVELDPDVDAAQLPRFESCYFGEVEGRSSRNDLPKGTFDAGCEFEKFSEAPETTTAIGAMELPLGGRVLLTVLKKLFLQPGSGRKEKALHRGLDHHGRRLVEPILRLLQSEGLVSPYRRAGLDMAIWVPDRSKLPRVAKIITSPHMSGDSLLVKASNL